MVLIPESPNLHLMKGDVEKARLSLRYFRGPYGTVDQELSIMQDSLAKVYITSVNINRNHSKTP